MSVATYAFCVSSLLSIPILQGVLTVDSRQQQSRRKRTTTLRSTEIYKGHDSGESIEDHRQAKEKNFDARLRTGNRAAPVSPRQRRGTGTSVAYVSDVLTYVLFFLLPLSNLQRDIECCIAPYGCLRVTIYGHAKGVQVIRNTDHSSLRKPEKRPRESRNGVWIK